MRAESRKGPLEAYIILFMVFIIDKVVVLFVDRVVSEVHKFIIFVNVAGVGLRRKSSQSLFKHINFERLITCDEDVDSQIKFVTVNEQRVGDVARND